MLNSPESNRQYPGRLKVFFDFLKLDGDIDKQAKTFVINYTNDNDYNKTLKTLD